MFRHYLATATFVTFLTLSTAQAGLIFGWSRFGAATGSNALPPSLLPNADGTGGLFDGSISLLQGTSSTATGGSFDGTWGTLLDPGNPPGSNNGFVTVSAGNRIDLYLTNPSPSYTVSLTLSDIYFDNVKLSSGTGTLSLWWEVGAPTQLLALTRTGLDPGILSQDYPTAGPAAQTFFLDPGEQQLVLSFRTSNRTFQLDNIRIDGDFSAIPEVSSALVLGGLLSTGFLIRRRPRKALAV
ncbi:MAG: hypothetical protein ACKV19_25915 [Verrucomicrobiales bacterium]